MRKRLDGAVRRATKSAELSWLKRLRYPFLKRKVDLGVEKVDVFAGTGVFDEGAGEEMAVAAEYCQVAIDFVEH